MCFWLHSEFGIADISVMLDIGIGLIIIYLAGAVLVSAIQELIASLLQWRSKHLKESILQMMLNANPTSSDTKTQLTVAKELRDNIYKSSFVQSLNHTNTPINWLGNRQEITEQKYKELFTRTDRVPT